MSRDMGYTHVELLPITEHPFDGSWGYQTVGYFAPTSRFGTPQDFMSLVDTLHRAGIGVILDWVPAHFPRDGHGLGYFDGTHLYEHADPRQGQHPDWGTFIFNYGRNEVRELPALSNALFWLERYHIDGLRIDAVASMLYLDYSRKEGEWLPNRFGGRENLEAIDFLRTPERRGLRELTRTCSTSPRTPPPGPGCRGPTYLGGLGFGSSGTWAGCTTRSTTCRRDPIHRTLPPRRLTFRMLYAFNENFMLPLSHDEVVHGKGSLLGKMPGDHWQRSRTCACCTAACTSSPARSCCSWAASSASGASGITTAASTGICSTQPPHHGVQRLVRDLNRALPRASPRMHAARPRARRASSGSTATTPNRAS